MAFIWLLLYLVVIYIRPAEWMPAFQGWQLIDVVSGVTALFLMAEISLTKRGFVKLPHNRLMLGLVVAIVCSHLAHTYVGGAQQSLVAFLPHAIMYFLIVNAIQSERKLHVTLWVLVSLTALLAIQGIQQFKTEVGWAGQPLPPDQRITWIGIFNDPNDLALAFVIVVPILFGAVYRRSFIVFKLVPLYLLGLLGYGIYLTNSRGGILALMASVAFFFVKRSKWVIPGGVIGGTLATLIFLYGPSRLQLLSAEEDSAYGRLDAWYYGFQLWKQSPLFGAGHQMFTDDYFLAAHNSFVLAFAELGLVGFFCWVGLLYTAFKGLSLVQRHNAQLAPYAYGLQASLVGFAAAAFFLSRTYVTLPYLLVALSATLFNVARSQTPAIDFRFTARDGRNVLVACAGIVVLLQFAMKTWL